MSGNGTGSATLTLAAGLVKSLYVLDIETPDDFGTDSHYTWLDPCHAECAEGVLEQKQFRFGG